MRLRKEDNRKLVKSLAILFAVACLAVPCSSLFFEHVSIKDNLCDLQTPSLVLDENETIDSLAFSTYICGSYFDAGGAVAVDQDNNLYITGIAHSTDFPVKDAYQNGNAGESDLFILKLSPSGNLLYSTYFGGSGYESGTSIAVDPVGNVYVTGSTSSSDFPLVGAYQSSLAGGEDMFILKLDPNGDPVYSTYFGGNDTDLGRSIAVDQSGNAVVCGYTSSADFPVIDALQENYSGESDAFVVKLDPTGEPIFSTYIGGSAEDFAYSTFLDCIGYIYVTGSTRSADFPIKDAYQDAKGGAEDVFVLELCPTGCLMYSTFIGGNMSDGAYSGAVDDDGNIYLAGETFSNDFPIVNGFQETLAGQIDMFVLKLNVSGLEMDFSTYFGGSGPNTHGWDYACSIALDPSGNIYVAGDTLSTSFPTLNAYQDNYHGESDVAVIKFSPDGVPIYSSYYGGDDEDLGNSIVVLPNGNVCVVGATRSTDFPLMDPYHDTLDGTVGVLVIILGEKVIKEEAEDNTMMYVVITGIAIVAIVVLGIMVMRRKKSP